MLKKQSLQVDDEFPGSRIRYVQIHATSSGWADSVILKKHHELASKGIDSYVIWGRSKITRNDHEFILLKHGEHEVAALATRIDGKYGFHNVGSTKRLIEILNKIQPDVVHLHSLIDYYVNVEILFEWLLEYDCEVVWTLHDCWPFTGGCMHFTMAECVKWKTACTKPCPCPDPDHYPVFNLYGNVDWCYNQKRKLFTALPADKLTLIAPSKWMADLTRESFLAKYPVKVVHNEVDKNIFKPTKCAFRRRYGLDSRFMILGVAGRWGPRKGLDDFIHLSHDLDENFAIVMVGLTKKQIESFPKKASTVFIGLEGIESRKELAGLYTCADVLFNPTKEDNYPTVNLEAQACGTMVISYDVGGSSETLWLTGSIAVDGYEQGLQALQRIASSNHDNEGFSSLIGGRL